jgi:hypothetical protein
MATCALMLCGVRCSCEGTNASHPTVEGQHEQLVRDLMDEGGLSRRHASIAAVAIKARYAIERKEPAHPRRPA